MPGEVSNTRSPGSAERRETAQRHERTEAGSTTRCTRRLGEGGARRDKRVDPRGVEPEPTAALKTPQGEETKPPPAPTWPGESFP